MVPATFLPHEVPRSRVTIPRFRGRLFRPEGRGTWTFVEIPRSISQSRHLRAHMRVKGRLDDTPFASSLMPRGGGVFFLVVNSQVRESLGKAHGDPVTVILELDTSPLKVVVPQELTRAFRSDPSAKGSFEGLAPSHRKAFAQWVGSAKQAETRERRAAKALRMLHRGETLNG